MKYQNHNKTCKFELKDAPKSMHHGTSSLKPSKNDYTSHILFMACQCSNEFIICGTQDSAYAR